METKLDEIKQLVDEAIKDGRIEEDDFKRSLIYGKCLDSIRNICKSINTL